MKTLRANLKANLTANLTAKTVKFGIRSLLLVGLLALASPALAVTAVDVDTLYRSDLGYVASGDTLTYEHNFDPLFDSSIAVNSVGSAFLFVAIADDWNCVSLSSCAGDWFFEGEVASIDLNATDWMTGQATAQVFWGDVTAEADLLNNNGTLEVTVSSERGDFVVLWSKLVTNYDYDVAGVTTSGGGTGTGTGAAPMPEPSAALVFTLGAVVMGGTIRRRRVS